MSESGFVLVRHGATEWSQNGRHTSRTDLPLLDSGRDQALALRSGLAGSEFERVLCSPLRRARETCQLAGFGHRAEITEDLLEWDYGEYEGLTSPEIRERVPDWSLWTDGTPGGEGPEDVTARVDRIIEQVGTGLTLCFAHGHILRVMAARWIGLEAALGERFILEPATLSVLGHEHAVTRSIERWNAATL